MIQIIDVVAFCKLDEAISLRQPDFILSTLQLTPTPIPQVTVHVFLSQEDQMNIEAAYRRQCLFLCSSNLCCIPARWPFI